MNTEDNKFVIILLVFFLSLLAVVPVFAVSPGILIDGEVDESEWIQVFTDDTVENDQMYRRGIVDDPHELTFEGYWYDDCQFLYLAAKITSDMTGWSGRTQLKVLVDAFADGLQLNEDYAFGIAFDAGCGGAPDYPDGFYKTPSWSGPLTPLPEGVELNGDTDSFEVKIPKSLFGICGPICQYRVGWYVEAFPQCAFMVQNKHLGSPPSWTDTDGWEYLQFTCPPSPVIPEVPLGTIAATTVMIIAVAAFITKPTLHLHPANNK